MAKVSAGSFSRRGPDFITEQLAVILSGEAGYEFKPLFDLVYANLRAQNRASGGEEMLRLRAYEKLQSLVSRGAVEKSVTTEGKKYRGLASLATSLPAVVALEPALPT